VDWAIVFLPAIAVALGASLLALRLSEPAAFRALGVLWDAERNAPADVRKAWGDLAPLLEEQEAPGLPEGVREALARNDFARAGELLQDHHLMFTLAIGEREEMKLPEKMVGFHIEKIIPKFLRAIALYGVLALYFTLFTSSKRGATPGKRMLRIRVASLEGGRVPLLESLERFVGYIEIAATLGFALLALWRDPNRRLPHDRVAGTVVLLDRPEPVPKSDPPLEQPEVDSPPEPEKS
jgi:hypothetical protein